MGFKQPALSSPVYFPQIGLPEHRCTPPARNLTSPGRASRVLSPGSLQCQQRAEAEQRKEFCCRRQLCHLLLELQPLAEGRALLGGEETTACLLLEQRQARNLACVQERAGTRPPTPHRSCSALSCSSCTPEAAAPRGNVEAFGSPASCR